MATCARVSDTLREGGVYTGLGLRGHSGLDQASKMKASLKKCLQENTFHYISVCE